MTERASALGQGRISALIAHIRMDGWLSPSRARTYGRLLAIYSLLLGIVLTGIYIKGALDDPQGRPLSTDFNAYWSAACLALRGQSELAYNPPALHAEEAVGAQQPQHLPFMYPPTFLLLCMKLGLLPYLPAVAVFVLGGYALAAATLRRIVPPGWTLLPFLGFPAAVLNAISTQNGSYSAACLGGAMLLLERRPALAGALLGGFIAKPQLGICIPVALAAARRWTALTACAATTGAIVLASWAVLGGNTWRAFAAFIPATRAISQSPNVWGSGVSVYAAARILGAGADWAYAYQGAAALTAILGLAWTCARRPGAGAEMAAMACAGLLCTPYLMDYDLVCLAAPMAWILREADGGWRPWEKAVLQLAYAYPLAARALTISAGLPVTPLVMGAMLAVVLARGAARPLSRA